MELTILEAHKISTEEYKDLVATLLETFVHGNGSPLSDMMDKFEVYLDTATGMDDDQKQAAYADLLRDTYSDINKQVMNTALSLLQANEELSLKKYSTQAAYNKTLADIALAEEQTLLTAANTINAGVEKEMAERKIISEQLAQSKALAELEKQWGLTVTLANTVTTEVTDEFGTVTRTTTYGVPSTAASPNDSVIAKQIRGYDMVNYKDVLKTLDERVALMQNAKVPESDADRELRAELIKYILEGIEIQNATVQWVNNAGTVDSTDGVLGNSTITP